MKNLKTKSILACAVLASVLGAGMPVWAAGESISLEQFVAASKRNGVTNDSARAMEQQYDGGGGATALGYNSNAAAAFATALGWGAQANRLGATAIGSNSVATRDHALAVGDGSKAEGENSTALGYMNEAKSDSSTAVGNHNTVEGSEGAAFGVGNNITRSTGIALGSKNLVSGVYAITLGSNSQAQKDYSVAMGSYAIANGVESMALGRDSQTGASAVGAMAFGSSARATGAGALAVGSFSESAKRDYAVKYCKELIKRVVTEPPEQGTPFERTVRAITGDNYEEWLKKDTDTFIEDLDKQLTGVSFKNYVMPVVAGNEDGNMDGTTASGLNAISFGASTKPQGNMASGANSIAIGTDARAEHANSVALGSNSITSAENTISLGAPGAERRIMNVATGTAGTDAVNLAQMNAAIAGITGGSSLWEAGTGENSVILKGGSNVATGDYSLAVGKENTASGETSAAIGLQNTASGQASVAMGFKSTAGGNYSLAAGYRSRTEGGASVAIGAKAVTKGYAAVSLGEDTVANTNAVALGYKTKAEGKGATATGYGSEAYGEGSFAGGGHVSNTQVAGGKAYGESSFAFGTGAVAGASGGTGNYTFAFGNNALASKDNTIALGSGAQAIHENSVALGNSSVTVADYTVAIGDVSNGVLRRITGLADGVAATDAATVAQAYSLWSAGTGEGSVKMTVGNNTASNVNAVAMGKESTATGEASVVMGQESTAGGNYSLAAGYRSRTEGAASVAIGSGAVTNGYAAVSLGQDTVANTNAVALGYKTKAEGKGATATGYGSEAYGEGSFAGGGHVTNTQVVGGKAYGESSFAFGTGAVAGASGGTGNYTFAFGSNALASMDNAIAFGSGAKAVHQNSVALGSNSVTSAMNTISVGSSGGERRITNVADGTADTDAATVGQVKAKSDYYVKGGNVRVDGVNNKPYLDLNIFNNATGASVDTISIDVSSIGGGSVISGDKILTPGTNIGFTPYTDPADAQVKYAVGLTDNISGLKSVVIGTATKNIYLDDDGVSVTGTGSLTDSHLASVMTADRFYLGEGNLDTVSNSYVGTVYSEITKDTLKINQKTYINENGIDANGQKIVNVADGALDTDAASYGQVKNKADRATTLAGYGITDAYTKSEVYTKTEIDTAISGTMADAYTGSVSVTGNSANLILTSTFDSSKSISFGLVAGTNIDFVEESGKIKISAAGEAEELVHKGGDVTAVRIGTGTEAVGQNAVVFGNNSKANADDAVAIGYNNIVTGMKSTAVGNNNVVSGNNSGVFGDPSHIEADNAYGVGNNNTIRSSATGSFAVGNNNDISGENTFVFGSNVTSTSKNSVILGNNSTDGGDNTVSVGTPNGERRIVNVADGTDAHDAVNYGQLQAAMGATGTGEAFVALQNDVANMSSQIDRMGTRISKVGAGAAALAAMHPVYDPESKLTFSAGVGNYKSETAAAVGLFYRFDDRVMLNFGASVGNDNDMYNMGLNFALGRHTPKGLPTKQVMYQQLISLQTLLNEQKAENAAMHNENSTMRELLLKQSAENAAIKEQIDAQKAQHDAQIVQLLAMIEELKNR